MAKLKASRVATRAASEAVQIHGGIGYMLDSPVARFYCDSKVLEIGEGTNEIQHVVIARAPWAAEPAPKREGRADADLGLRRRVAAVDHHRRTRRPARGLTGEIRVGADQVIGQSRVRADAFAAIASIASCDRSAWIADTNVPGHTQLTRIPSRAYSTAATLARWITPAFVDAVGSGVRPRGETGNGGGQDDRTRTSGHAWGEPRRGWH